MLDKLSLLIRLQAIVDAGSLRSAAKDLGLTQSALSRSLAQLERHFGQPLLERRARGVAPTGFGREVLSAAARIARDWEITESNLRAGGSAHVLRIQAGPFWSARVLPEILGRLVETSPGLTIEMRTAIAGQSHKDLLEGRSDLLVGGIDLANAQNLGLVIRPFTVIQNRIMARADHPLAGLQPVSPEALHLYPWLVYTGSPNYREETLHMVTNYTGRPPAMRLFSDSLLSVTRILQTSDCLCVLADGALAGVSNPGILPLPVDIDRRRLETGAIYRAAMASWQPLEAFLTLCEDYFRDLDGAEPAAP